MNARAAAAEPFASERQYVTARVGGQLFGLPILAVNEVFEPEGIARVPLAPPVIEGVLNLRGRIVTMIGLRSLLGFPPNGADERSMAIGVELKGEAYGLLIDEVGDVMRLDAARHEPVPSNLDRRWAEIVSGVHRLEHELMLIIDVERVLGGVLEPHLN
jgi:purine-binding chemotaxis protein CheW